MFERIKIFLWLKWKETRIFWISIVGIYLLGHILYWIGLLIKSCPFLKYIFPGKVETNFEIGFEGFLFLELLFAFGIFMYYICIWINKNWKLAGRLAGKKNVKIHAMYKKHLEGIK